MPYPLSDEAVEKFIFDPGSRYRSIPKSHQVFNFQRPTPSKYFMNIHPQHFVKIDPGPNQSQIVYSHALPAYSATTVLGPQ